jgi:hypothetical protein
MSYRLEQLPDEPIIVLSLLSDSSLREQISDSAEEATLLIEEAAEEWVYLIYDVRNLRPNFSDLVGALGQATKATNLFKNPRLRTVVVGSGPLVEMGVKALSQEQYGGRPAPLFETVEEAIDYARQQVTGG